MAIDRAEARRRVRTVTGWAAGGAIALTAGFAFGAARGSNAAKTTTPAASDSQSSLPPESVPQDAQGGGQRTPQGAYPQDEQGFAPPAGSTGPPAGMSGGS